MRDKKVYIILFVVLIVFFVVMFLVFGVENINQSKYSTTILVGDNTIWTYKNKNWVNVNTKSSISKLNWKKYNVFLDNKSFGNYYLWHDDKWYAFDNSKNAVNLDGNFLAYQANFKMKILDFTQEEINDRTYVDAVLAENQISLSSQFTSSYKVSLDFDNDEKLEDFYLISNAFPLDFDPEKIFSIVFMVKNEKIYYIYNDVSENRSFNGCKPFFNSFLDTNNDKTYEFILSCGRYSVSEQIDMLYKFENDSFKIVISN